MLYNNSPAVKYTLLNYNPSHDGHGQLTSSQHPLSDVYSDNACTLLTVLLYYDQ